MCIRDRATGKNVLAECLAAAFGRPSWDVSFYINTDAASLVGTDTFKDGAVSFRPGPITQCATCLLYTSPLCLPIIRGPAAL